MLFLGCDSGLIAPCKLLVMFFVAYFQIGQEKKNIYLTITCSHREKADVSNGESG